ncbi:hypothetical protein [Streptococcus sp. zg-JUN1979]|uniref:hypothetical protein n=1 Tax=Streptococcus sp. zg-JUN1979 TaxID=3391450 RepID=UPI0039AF4980
MKSVIKNGYKWWMGRSERYYKQAQMYYDTQDKEALWAEYIELEVRKIEPLEDGSYL